MNTAREINWDLIAGVDVSILIQFYSDTNLSNALDEFDILDLDSLEKTGRGGVTVSSAEFRELEEPIMAIVEAWGGSLAY